LLVFLGTRRLEHRGGSGPLAAFARGAVRWVRNDLRIRETSAGLRVPDAQRTEMRHAAPAVRWVYDPSTDGCDETVAPRD
jgi:hypothetical protein